MTSQWRIRVECWLSYTHASAYTRTGTHTCARTHRQICTMYCFSAATIIRESASVIRTLSVLLRSLSPYPAIFVFGGHMSRCFPRHKNTTYMTICTEMLTFRRWQKTSVEVGYPSTGHEQEGIWEGAEDVWISDCRVWTETAKDGERICEEEWVVNRVSHYYYYYYYYYYLFVLEC